MSFDEEISFVLDHGVVNPPTRNSGIGYYDDDPDVYVFSWSMFPDSDFSIYGLQWTISPDLISGAVLPPIIDSRVSFFAGGAIWVVPEPSGILGMMVATIGICNYRRNRNSQRYCDVKVE